MPSSSPLQNQVRAHILVSGRVQGVGYRMSTCEKANNLGITGWVRNLPNGQVEAVFEGTRDIVEHMVAWCRQGNPPAVVKDVVVDYEAPEGFQAFDILR